MNAISKFLRDWETMSDEEKAEIEKAWARNHERDHDSYTPCYSSIFW